MKNLSVEELAIKIDKFNKKLDWYGCFDSFDEVGENEEIQTMKSIKQLEQDIYNKDVRHLIDWHREIADELEEDLTEEEVNNLYEIIYHLENI